MVDVGEFIKKWSPSGGNERVNAIPFLNDLCDVIGVDKPKPAEQSSKNDDYRFERYVKSKVIVGEKQNRIDFYRKGSFILEAKQGIHANSAQRDHAGHGVRGSFQHVQTMKNAYMQADQYARAIAHEDGWVPFIIVCDIGYRFDIYSDFSGKGFHYMQFPDPENYRIQLEDLHDEKVRELLRRIWTNPYSLNPEIQQTKVTKDIANQLAVLGLSLEEQGHSPQDVADFLMRFVFSMFAENVGLIPGELFSETLKDLKHEPKNANLVLSEIWRAMNKGEYSIALHRGLRKFNGGLFKERKSKQMEITLTHKQIELLIEAAEYSWKDVEPAIFGTLLERALDKDVRHKLGAHYTPRSYVEQLVIPTVIDPLRREWNAVQALVLEYMENGKSKEALKAVRKFHEYLCEIRILDPACGSGNFLYVTFEHMKKLEGEVTALLGDLGEKRKKLTLAGQVVDPSQFLGIEINPWAVSVAELVLWIGYLQQHFRIYRNVMPAEPVLRDFQNIKLGDAILGCDQEIERKDEHGNTVTRWDGKSFLTSPTTGKEIPDPDALIPVYDLVNPRPPDWPKADFIVGNPPFIGDKRRRSLLGDGYSEALKLVYPNIASSTDFVMYWWNIAAKKVRSGETKSFGLITTNSLSQKFNKRVVEKHLKNLNSPLSLKFAVPDHPWVDEVESANVRIAMTVGVAGDSKGDLAKVVEEKSNDQQPSNGNQIKLEYTRGKIHSDLKIGPDLSMASPLQSQSGISSLGLMLAGKGFKVNKEKAVELGLNNLSGLDAHIKPYCNGSDLYQHHRNLLVIDLLGVELEEVKAKFPAVYEHLFENVKPERDLNNRKVLREKWWLVAEPRKLIRPALKGLEKYIVTAESSKHRIFQFIPGDCLPDHRLIAIASDNAAHLAVLSSHIHIVWSGAIGGRLGPATVYNKTNCFDKFPFPKLTTTRLRELQALGEKLDRHRKTQLGQFPELTLTDIYNVREKFRAKIQLSKKEKTIYNKGLIRVLDEVHRNIDSAVAKAYGWSDSITENEILSNLIELNQTRVGDEEKGKILWLRPEYQRTNGTKIGDLSSQTRLERMSGKVSLKRAWPKKQIDQLRVIMELLSELHEATPELIAKQFKSVKPESVQKPLEMLKVTGAVVQLESGEYQNLR